MARELRIFFRRGAESISGPDTPSGTDGTNPLLERALVGVDGCDGARCRCGHASLGTGRSQVSTVVGHGAGDEVPGGVSDDPDGTLELFTGLAGVDAVLDGVGHLLEAVVTELGGCGVEAQDEARLVVGPAGCGRLSDDLGVAGPERVLHGPVDGDETGDGIDVEATELDGRGLVLERGPVLTGVGVGGRFPDPGCEQHGYSL